MNGQEVRGIHTESCNSQCLSHFAGAFIVDRAKTSIIHLEHTHTHSDGNLVMTSPFLSVVRFTKLRRKCYAKAEEMRLNQRPFYGF